MAAPALILAERHCARCRRMKPVEQFRSHPYCIECRSTYMRERYAAIKAGTWAPKSREEYAPRPPSPPPPAPKPEAKAFACPASADDRLRTEMELFLLNFGFTALTVTVARIASELSKTHRERLAREGWIA